MPIDNNKIDVMRYQRSISKELIVLKDRVRSLIGSKHWGEEGRYKEIILMNFLRKHLPTNMSVGTGFIMDGNNYNDISSQIDLIIYNDSYPLIFKENDFILVHSNSVLGMQTVHLLIRAVYSCSTLHPVLCSVSAYPNIFYPARSIRNHFH